MNKRNLMIVSVAAIGLGALTLIPVVAVSAQEAVNAPQTNFVAKLAERLGLSIDSVQTAVDLTKAEVKAEKIEEIQTSIAQAVTDGKLTQRQADILNKMDEVHESLETNREGLTKEQRDAQRTEIQSLTQEERKIAKNSKIVETLNELGLNTNSEEVEAAKSAAKEANIMQMGGLKGGRGGFGSGRGMIR